MNIYQTDKVAVTKLILEGMEKDVLKHAKYKYILELRWLFIIFLGIGIQFIIP